MPLRLSSLPLCGPRCHCRRQVPWPPSLYHLPSPAERVCSGLGIANIYDFLRDADPASETVPFAARLARESDRTPLIVRAGLTDPVNNSRAAAALDLFVAALADEAGNLALKVLSTGGVYLAGGIPRRVLPKLIDGRFMQAFVK